MSVAEYRRTLPLKCMPRKDDKHVYTCNVYQLYLIAASFKESDTVSSEVIFLFYCVTLHRLPLWSSGQSFWLQIQRSRVRYPALPDFLSSSGSGTGSTQPREPREVN